MFTYQSHDIIKQGDGGYKLPKCLDSRITTWQKGSIWSSLPRIIEVVHSDYKTASSTVHTLNPDVRIINDNDVNCALHKKEKEKRDLQEKEERRQQRLRFRRQRRRRQQQRQREKKSRQVRINVKVLCVS